MPCFLATERCSYRASFLDKIPGAGHLLGTTSCFAVPVMLTSRYMVTTKNLPAIMDAMIKGTAPPKFTAEHLAGLGFKSSNDRAIIPLLKDLKLLSDDGTPTPRYHQYRGDPRRVLGEALKEAYEDIF